MSASRTLLAVGLLTAAPLGITPALADPAFPKGPIQIVVPYAPGGNLDITTRIVAPFLGEALGTQVIVINKPGAGGSVAASQVSRLEADGYTLMTTANTELSVAPHLTNAAYRINSFELVGTVSTVPMVVEVTPDSPFKSFRELLTAACAKPDSVSIGIAGIGSVNYLALMRLQEATGCRFLMVPYQGSGPALQGAMGKQTDAIIDQVSSSRPYLDGKRLKALVMLSDDKVSWLPDVPSLAQVGVKGADLATSAAFVAPRGLPPAVATKLRTALKTAMQRKEVQDKLAELGALAFTGSSDHFMEMIKPLEDMAVRYKAEGKLQTN